MTKPFTKRPFYRFIGSVLAMTLIASCAPERKPGQASGLQDAPRAVNEIVVLQQRLSFDPNSEQQRDLLAFADRWPLKSPQCDIFYEWTEQIFDAAGQPVFNADGTAATVKFRVFPFRVGTDIFYVETCVGGAAAIKGAIHLSLWESLLPEAYSQTAATPVRKDVKGCTTFGQFVKDKAVARSLAKKASRGSGRGKEIEKAAEEVKKTERQPRKIRTRKSKFPPFGNFALFSFCIQKLLALGTPDAQGIQDKALERLLRICTGEDEREGSPSEAIADARATLEAALAALEARLAQPAAPAIALEEPTLIRHAVLKEEEAIRAFSPSQAARAAGFVLCSEKEAIRAIERDFAAIKEEEEREEEKEEKNAALAQAAMALAKQLSEIVGDPQKAELIVRQLLRPLEEQDVIDERLFCNAEDPDPRVEFEVNEVLMSFLVFEEDGNIRLVPASACQPQTAQRSSLFKWLYHLIVPEAFGEDIVEKCDAYRRMVSEYEGGGYDISITDSTTTATQTTPKRENYYRATFFIEGEKEGERKEMRCCGYFDAEPAKGHIFTGGACCSDPSIF